MGPFEVTEISCYTKYKNYLKEFFMKKMTYFIAILSFTASHLSQSSECSLVYPAVWGMSAAMEVVMSLSKNARHMFYGNNPLEHSAKNNLWAIINNLNLPQPGDVQQSRSLWPMMAGSIYPNYDTLFVSKDVCKELQAHNLSNDSKQNLITALLMINTRFDDKVLAAFIATPIILWSAIHCLQLAMEKYKWNKNELLTQITQLTVQEKSIISAFIIGAFCLSQRLMISAQVKKLMH
jgi:hypothetical protein